MTPALSEDKNGKESRESRLPTKQDATHADCLLKTYLRSRVLHHSFCGRVSSDEWLRPSTLQKTSKHMISRSPCISSVGRTARKHTLLPQVGLSLLHGGHHHVSNGSSGHSVQTSVDAFHCHDKKVLCASVVSTVDHRTHGQTEGYAKLRSSKTSTS